jgi:hypothetical protein
VFQRETALSYTVESPKHFKAVLMKNLQKIANSNAKTFITNMSFVLLWKEHKVDRWTMQENISFQMLPNSRQSKNIFADITTPTRTLTSFPIEVNDHRDAGRISVKFKTMEFPSLMRLSLSAPAWPQTP